MARLFHALIAVVVLYAAASGQGNLKSHLLPITSPIKRAGVYHVSTGTWTRGASLANGVGPSVLYNNSCTLVYYTTMLSTERFQHRSRIPSNDADSTPAPTTDNAYYGTTNSNHRYDERPGCAGQYTVNGFDFEYCSSHVGRLTWTYQFAHSYTACDAADMVPDYTITVGLPGGTAVNGPACWIVGIDVSNETGSNMVLSADGNGTYEGPSTSDQFGWSFGVNPAIALDGTGPIIAGNFTWTGGGAFGLHTPCTGTDGTVWDSLISPGCGPIPPAETLGTGMSSNDFFRIAGGPVSQPNGPGCYNFGGNPHADFYLRLFGVSGCPAGCTYPPFCAPGVGGIVTCPCGNPQIPAGATKGCNNFGSSATGGAILVAAGVAATNAIDSLSFSLTKGVLGAVTVLFQGTTNDVNARTGAGVRCVGGTLKRLYKGDQGGWYWGAIDFPNNGVPVHVQSEAKGYTIAAPITLYYYCVYRNSAANGWPGCPGTSFGFNSTNAVAVPWTP